MSLWIGWSLAHLGWAGLGNLADLDCTHISGVNGLKSGLAGPIQFASCASHPFLGPECSSHGDGGCIRASPAVQVCRIPDLLLRSGHLVSRVLLSASLPQITRCYILPGV